MRLLVIVILIASSGWSTYWFVGKSIRQATLNNWFNEKSENGWDVQNTLHLRGFPNRFDAIIEDINLNNPKSGLKWSADRLEILQLSYKPNHFIVLGPLEQKLQIFDQKLFITSKKLRGSLVFQTDSELELDRSTISSEKLIIETSTDTFFAAEKIILALRRINNSENIYDIALDLREVFSSRLNLKNYDPYETMPNEFEILTLDASAEFDKPLNQKSFDQKLYNISNFKINKTELVWGSFKLKAVGNLSLDPDGYLTGNITIRATNWKQVFDLVLDNRVTNKETKNAIRTLFKLFGNISQNNQALEIPLKFSNKKIFIGIIPIANSPKINLY